MSHEYIQNRIDEINEEAGSLYRDGVSFPYLYREIKRAYKAAMENTLDTLALENTDKARLAEEMIERELKEVDKLDF